MARRFASRTNDTWPSWSAPMVGTSAVVAFFALRLSRARRNAGTVRTIMGLRDIWARSLGSGRLRGLRRGRRPYQDRRLAAKPARADYRSTLTSIRQKMCTESQTRRAAHAIHRRGVDDQPFDDVVCAFYLTAVARNLKMSTGIETCWCRLVRVSRARRMSSCLATRRAVQGNPPPPCISQLP